MESIGVMEIKKAHDQIMGFECIPCSYKRVNTCSPMASVPKIMAGSVVASAMSLVR
jgi:hypothetical protein